MSFLRAGNHPARSPTSYPPPFHHKSPSVNSPALSTPTPTHQHPNEVPHQPSPPGAHGFNHHGQPLNRGNRASMPNIYPPGPSSDAGTSYTSSSFGNPSYANHPQSHPPQAPPPTLPEPLCTSRSDHHAKTTLSAHLNLSQTTLSTPSNLSRTTLRAHLRPLQTTLAGLACPEGGKGVTEPLCQVVTTS